MKVTLENNVLATELQGCNAITPTLSKSGKTLLVGTGRSKGAIDVLGRELVVQVNAYVSATDEDRAAAGFVAS